MRIFLSYIAKLLYRDKYARLRDKLLNEYHLLKQSHSHRLDTMTKLLISGEDHRFLHHIGFDIIAIMRAIKNRIIYNKIEGASTIEQQLVRVITNDFDKTFQRKFQEILLATTLTSIVPKKAIPEIYLNVAYYGTGMNGLTEAMKKLDVYETDFLSLEKAAEIVSRIKYPEPLSPNLKRLSQIEKRKQHLISLFNKHKARKFIKVYG